MIPSNFTLEEIIKYALPREISDTLQPYFDKILEEITAKEEELVYLRRREELLSEQLYFAVDLIEEIEDRCKQTGTKKELVKGITYSIENSMFER